ncbi:hypothetical protein KR200_008660, partial [Drosophila serrata]
ADGFVRADVGGFQIYSCYLVPSLPLETFSRILEDLSSDLSGWANDIVGGDFNAWSQEWGSVLTNARGRVVLGALAATDVVLLNIGGRPTFVRTGAASIIELTFTGRAISHSAKWEVSDVYTGSGVPEAGIRSVLRPAKAYRPDTLCIRTFTNALEGMETGEPGGAEGMANHVAAALEHACDQSMRLRGSFRGRRRPVFWWSDDVRAAL